MFKVTQHTRKTSSVTFGIKHGKTYNEVYTPISTKMFKHRSFIVLSIVLIFAGRKDAVRLRLDQTPTKQNRSVFC